MVPKPVTNLITNITYLYFRSIFNNTYFLLKIIKQILHITKPYSSLSKLLHLITNMERVR